MGKVIVLLLALLWASSAKAEEPWSALQILQCGQSLLILVTFTDGGYEIVSMAAPVDEIMGTVQYVDKVPKERRRVMNVPLATGDCESPIIAGLPKEKARAWRAASE